MNIAKQIRQEQKEIHMTDQERVRPLLKDIRIYAVSHLEETYMTRDYLTEVERSVLEEYGYEITDCVDFYLISWDKICDPVKEKELGYLSASCVCDIQLELLKSKRKAEAEYNEIINAMQKHIAETNDDFFIWKKDISENTHNMLVDAGFLIKTYYKPYDNLYETYDYRRFETDICYNEISFKEVEFMSRYQIACEFKNQDTTDKIIEEIREFIKTSKSRKFLVPETMNTAVKRNLEKSGFVIKKNQETKQVFIKW